MNNLFITKRFCLLFKKTLLERPVQLLGFMGLSLTFTLLLYTFFFFIQKNFTIAQNMTFIWGIAGGGSFLASTVFSNFSTNANGLSYLTLPASQFEKWLCGIIIVGVLYPTIFLLFYRGIDSFYVHMYHTRLDPTSPFYKDLYESVGLFPYDSVFALKVYPLFIFLSGAMMLGSLYFNKTNFIKTALFICSICILAYVVNWLIAMSFFGAISDAGPLNHISILVGKEEGDIELPATLAKIFTYSFKYVLPSFLWLVAYIRLREKEF